MRTTYASFDLLAWRRRMGWTQARAAHELGMSGSHYRAAEYHCADTRGRPTKLQLIRLAQLLEDRPPKLQWQPPPLLSAARMRRREKAA